LDKYLGNKAALLPLIYQHVKSKAPNATSISDPFTGTTNVARYFRARGFDVNIADVNRFSYVLGNAYLSPRKPLAFEAMQREASTEEIEARIRREFFRAAQRLHGRFVSLSAEALWKDFSSAARALAALQLAGNRNAREGPIFRYFTQWGKDARFKSLRGSTGSRNYFSKQNALILDGILATLRRLWRSNAISRLELDFLLTAVIEEVVITANVAGTFHDFHRERLWPNALQPFTLRMPVTELRPTAVTIVNADARSAALVFDDHDVCYLDPPYNFRQYTAYYHFLNFVAAYPHLPSITNYLVKLEHVRGQNMSDDEASDFSCRDRFLVALRQLVSSSSARHVFLSYYSGRNHWNHWSVFDSPQDTGFHHLRRFFADRSLFDSYSVSTAHDIRKNFQSRVGEKKERVDEYIFYGLRRSLAPARITEAIAESNRRLGLSESFSPIRLRRQSDSKRLTMRSGSQGIRLDGLYEA
jgi:adenine-specific DNA-methyltransferase